MLPFRIGYGWDIHALSENSRPLMLGGVQVAPNNGCLGHSDGDVVLHALIDAILGALALGDIGQWFSDQDPQHKNSPSEKLLLPVLRQMRAHFYELGNIDITCCLERPKLAPFALTISGNIAQLCNIPKSSVAFKAKTSEKLDSVGRGEGIACSVVVALWLKK